MSDMYDYIIIGAGSAGSVMANRLSADPTLRVLVLEAGGSDNKLAIRMPMGVKNLLRTNWANWNYLTEPEAELNDRQLLWPRGKVLGGSSSINAMLYVRGNPLDYDGWARAGCARWSWEHVLPYFLKSEGSERDASPWHNTDGPLAVSQGHLDEPLFDAFFAAAEQAGHTINDDFNGPDQMGMGYYDTNIAKGERASAASAYLHPAITRDNLDVKTRTLTTRINLEGGRATGVTCMSGEREQVFRVRKEVILCGGTVNSPQLLLLSGIGPADEIRRHGIPALHDLAGVGKNLQDHLDVAMQFACPEPITSLRDLKINRQVGLLLKWLFRKDGVAAYTPAPIGGFLQSREGLTRPDLQLHYLNALVAAHGLEDPKAHGFTIHVCHLHPESRGQVRLKSADPMDDPAISPNYLSAPGDIAVLREGVRKVRQITSQPAFSALNGGELQIGAEAQSDAQIDAAIRELAETIYHPVGTCRMGVDDGAVVGPYLKVHGLDGLRVVDASIMPRVPSGNTNAPTIMIAEKAADMILG